MTDETHEKVEVHEGRRAGIVISVRLKPDEADLLDDLADRYGLSLSDTVRHGLFALRDQPRYRGEAFTGGASDAIDARTQGFTRANELVPS
jgi:hypothetical protein